MIWLSLTLAAGPQDPDTWADRIDQGRPTADLYFNLGNALHAEGEDALALTSWRRALWLDPRHEGAQINLARVRAELGEPRVVAPAEGWRAWARPAGLGWSGAAFFGLGMLVAAGAVQARRRDLQLGLGAVSALAIGLGGVLSAAQGALSGELDHPVGVVLSDQVEVRNGGEGVVLFTLHLGDEVRIRDQVDAQVQVQLDDGQRGWMPVAALGVVDPGLAAPRPPEPDGRVSD